MSNAISLKRTNRYKISIIALICALVFVGSMVIGIFAATQQNVKSQFSVVYSVGENVAVAVRTESYIPGYTPAEGETNPTTATKDTNGTTITNEQGYVVFNAPDEYSEKEIVIPNVNLSPATPKVEFLYTITNLNEQGYVQYDLLENLTTNTNVETTAYYYTGDNADPTKSATTYTSTGYIEQRSYIAVVYDNNGDSVAAYTVNVSIEWDSISEEFYLRN